MGLKCSVALVAAFGSLMSLPACSSGDDGANAANGGKAAGGAAAGGKGSAGRASGGSATGGSSTGGKPSAGTAGTTPSGSGGGSDGSSGAGATDPGSGLTTGYVDGHAEVPEAGRAEDVSSPTTVIGDGTAESCTSDAFVEAVAKGGVITFDCGAEPATIVLTETAKVFNDKGTKLVIDGGNKVTLSGGGRQRILYMATCDKAQVYPPGSGDCNTNPGVQLVVQNLTFIDGSAKGIVDGDGNRAGGGAIYAQGGSLKVVNSRFSNNVCDDLGSDLGGGAIRKLDYLVKAGVGPARPVWVVGSTFDGNHCANGGALSSIGVSWNILNSWFSNNQAVGMGANDGDGGNGGAIYNDGNEIVLSITSSLIESNHANEGGSAVFLVSNDRSGSLTVTDSITRQNPRGMFETAGLPGFFVQAKEPAKIVNSQILR